MREGIPGRRGVPDFPGFRSPNYTQVPEEFFEMAPTMLERHLKIMLYVMRRTFGFKKGSDRISLGQFLHGIVREDGTRLDYGCGLARGALLEGLRELETTGYLVVTRVTSASGERETNEYSLRLAPRPALPARMASFRAFQTPAKFVQVPDEVFDILLPDLNGGELRVLLFIIRQTYGFGRDSVALSRSEILSGMRRGDGTLLNSGAGVGASQMKSALKRLRDNHVIAVEQRYNSRGGCIASLYKLNVVSSEEDSSPGIEPTDRAESEPTPDSITVPNPRMVSDSAPRRGTGPAAASENSPTVSPNATLERGAAFGPDNKQSVNTTDVQDTQQQQRAVEQDEDVVVALTSMGVTGKIAESLVRDFPHERILAQVEMLPYRAADNPPAMLVRAIRENWAPPPRYAAEPDGAADETVPADEREDIADWRARQLGKHSVDSRTEAVWSAACQWIARFAGRAELPDWLRSAVLLPGNADQVDVLLPQIQYLLAAKHEYTEPVEAALATVLGRRLSVRFRHGP